MSKVARFFIVSGPNGAGKFTLDMRNRDVSLSELVVDDCGTITSADPIESESLGIIQNGKGNIDLSIEVPRLDATVTKSGALKLSGRAEVL